MWINHQLHGAGFKSNPSTGLFFILHCGHDFLPSTLRLIKKFKNHIRLKENTIPIWRFKAGYFCVYLTERKSLLPPLFLFFPL